ncbi:very short patch repair endonuclease [Streptomyces sp. NPDC058985]|uniref:very short patch repair endonuclease n=1 Tax=Streptomyces sp. NPDC058985 TaxID=3346684 RepID=UPI0036B4DF24
MPEPVPSSAAVSARMSRQGSRDTAPEIPVRRLLHASGMRYRVNVPMPGMARRTIEIVFPRAKVAIFLDGCFWHGCPQHATQPKSNTEGWRAKLDKNMARDVETTRRLQDQGWTVLRFWEHETPESVANRVSESLAEAVFPRPRIHTGRALKGPLPVGRPIPRVSGSC